MKVEKDKEAQLNANHLWNKDHVDNLLKTLGQFLVAVNNYLHIIFI